MSQPAQLPGMQFFNDFCEHAQAGIVVAIGAIGTDVPGLPLGKPPNMLWLWVLTAMRWQTCRSHLPKYQLGQEAAKVRCTVLHSSWQSSFLQASCILPLLPFPPLLPPSPPPPIPFAEPLIWLGKKSDLRWQSVGMRLTVAQDHLYI